MNRLIYLASPYSTPNGTDLNRAKRFEAVCYAAGRLAKKGFPIISPIIHWHTVRTYVKSVPVGFEFWADYDYALVRACREIFVLTLPDWNRSEGVSRELELARSILLPIRYVDEQGEFVNVG